jgi:hypothetical protein
LDSTFGFLGTKKYNVDFHVKNGLLVHNNYYFISTNSIVKVDYNGQIVASFGTNGYKTLKETNQTLAISDFVFYNNYFYLYGSVKNDATNNIDIYISKIDENGNYDTNFGANGILKLDFGLQESVASFVNEPSGNFYCIGTRNNQNISNTSRLILFKINNNGSVNNLFSPNGFKEISQNLSTSSAQIIPYNSKYLLLGTTTVNDGAFNRTKILLAEVDINGNPNTTFRINGFKNIPLENQGIYYNTIRNAQLLNGSLYINMNQGGAMLNDNSNNLLIYNLLNDQIISSVPHNQYFYSKTDNDGVFLNSYCYSCCGNNHAACNNTFELSKRNFDGTSYTSFHVNGTYSYEFTYAQPFTNQGDSRSYMFIKEPNGKFLIAGFVYNLFSVATFGFSAIRIVEGALGLNPPASHDKTSIYPNPFDNKIIFKNSKPVANVVVCDLVGRIITEPSFHYENDHTIIDLSYITQKGTYLLRITTDDSEIITEKIIKN